MKELKMILTGFIFIFTGISFLFLLTMPDALLLLAPVTPIPTPGVGVLSQLYTNYANTINFIHVVEIISSLLIIGGLVLSGFGTFYKEREK
jgi:hypothetical protein